MTFDLSCSCPDYYSLPLNLSFCALCLPHAIALELEARVEGAMTHYKQVQQERYDQMLASQMLREDGTSCKTAAT